MNWKEFIKELKKTNPEWLILVQTSMLTHYHNLAPPEMSSAHDTPNASSIYFCFALAILIAEVDWWPKSFSKPPRMICNIYQAVVANVLTNIVMNFVYVPMEDALKYMIKNTIREIQKMHRKQMEPIIKPMRNEHNQQILVGMFCFGLILMALYISERFGCVLRFIKKCISKVNSLP